MKGRIFLIRDLTYCALFDYPNDHITIVGEIREEITIEGVRRTPVVVAFKNEPIVCPYCMCSHPYDKTEVIIYPDCDPTRRKGIVKDELGLRYHPKEDGYYLQYR